MLQSICQKVVAVVIDVALIVTVTLLPSMAYAEVRLALVIGNGNYKNGMSALTAPINDAHDMEQVLTALGFRVTKRLDLGETQLEAELREFGDKVRVQRPDWALIYFSGHGYQINGWSYMMPVDTKAGTSVHKAMDDHLHAAKQLRIVFFDACRTDPEIEEIRVATSAVPKGPGGKILTLRPTLPEATVYAYASAQQLPAEAVGGVRNSTYTAALLANLAKPALEIREVLGEVATQVKKATANRPGWPTQTPSYEATLGAERFYFERKPVVVMAAVPTHGKIVNFFGGTYEGEIASDLPNGWGRFSRGEMPNGVIGYEGGWREGKFDGIGVATYKWRNTYQGQWRDGQKHGLGIERGPWNGEGFEYAGSFERNNRKGHGVHWVAHPKKDEESVKVGEFDTGLVDGVEVDVWMKDTHTFLSTGKRDKRGRLQGRGLRFNGEFYYRGNFRDGLFDGQGVRKDFDGTERFGLFREGKQDGLGFIKWPGEYSHYEGMVSNWLPNGFGSATYPEVRGTKRSRVSGHWSDGCHPDGAQFLCGKSK